MTVTNYSDLRDHRGHRLEIVVYGIEENVSLECLDCCEVLLDFDSTDSDAPEFIPATGKAVLKSDGERLVIKSASKDGEWYVDVRDRFYSREKLKYIKIALDSK